MKFWTVASLLLAAIIGVIIYGGMQADSLNKSIADANSSLSSSNTSSARTMQGVANLPELMVEDLVVGTGSEVTLADTITVNYEGTLTDGTVFDSSYSRGEPATFPLSGVIQGWQQGITGMKVGGKRKLSIPANLGYGSSPAGEIPPNSDLYFEVELLSISDK